MSRDHSCVSLCLREVLPLCQEVCGCRDRHLGPLCNLLLFVRNLNMTQLALLISSLACRILQLNNIDELVSVNLDDI